MKIPASIPKKYHSFITSCCQEDDLDCAEGGVGWVVDVKGISTADERHIIFERTLKEVVWELEAMSPCSCEACSNA